MVSHDRPDDPAKEQPNQIESRKDDPTDSPGDDAETESREGPLLDRRSVLKMASVTTVVGMANAVNAIDPVRADRDVSPGEEYDTWTISGKEVYDLSDGEVLENVLVDQTADGASLMIRSRNKTDWEVRNVGFEGVGQASDGGNRFQFQVSTPSGGHGVIENVWANGKARDGQPASELGGIYLRSPHGGHIDVRHTYIEGFGNNAVYASAVGKDSGNEGSVAIENSYHRDNTSSQFRIGSPDSVVRNCVGLINDPDGKRGVYPGTSSNRNARGIWGKHFRDQRIENCSFHISPDDTQPDGVFEARYITDRSHGEEAVAEIQGCQVNGDAPTLTGSTSNAKVNITNLGESPTVDVIEDGGVPTSPKMAARGEREMPPALPGESDDSTSEPDDTTSLSYGNDAFPVSKQHYDTGDMSGVEFSMTNTADQDLTVTHVTVTPHDSSINELHDESDEVGPWVSEVHIDADTQDGVCDAPSSSTLPNTFDMANDGWDDEADDVAVMSAGSAASMALSRFEDNGSPVDMTGKKVDIDVDYELGDGSTSTDSFTITPEDIGSAPAVESLSLSEVETGTADAEFDADWQVGDADGNLDSVDLTLSDDTDGKTEDTATPSVSGDTASGTTRLVAAGDDVSGNEYTVELVVTDSDGVTASDATSVTENDPDPVLTTGSNSDLTGSSATLNGSLDDLGGADSAEVSFEWREIGASSWNSTAAETVTATGSFSHDLTGLSADTTHEYRATADASDGESVTGSAAEFTTAVALDRTLTFDGTDADRTDYEVAVSEDIENDPDNGGFNDGDSIEGPVATGFVNGGIDGYRFSGEIVGIEVDGDATVLVDGEAVDPDSLILPNHIVFEAANSQVETTYEVEISSDLVNDPLLGPVEDDDTVDGARTTGAVTDGDRDGFRFSGDLVSLQLDGEASVVIEDTDG